MQYYWYSQDFTKLPEWSDTKSAKILTANSKYLKIKLIVLENGHQIDIQTSPNEGFTQIFAENLPIKLIPEAEFFDEKHFVINSVDGKSTTKINEHIEMFKFEQEILEEFLKTEDCVFYYFPDESWRILRWNWLDNSDNKLAVTSLHAIINENVILQTKSVFEW